MALSRGSRATSAADDDEDEDPPPLAAAPPPREALKHALALHYSLLVSPLL